MGSGEKNGWQKGMEQQVKADVHHIPTVLIVDDQPTFLELARLILAKGNLFRVVGTAHDGASCLQTAEELNPDIVLLDIELPDGNGVELCGKLVKRHPKTAVVIMSAHTEDVYRDEAIRLGAREFIRKHELSAIKLKQALDCAAGR